MKALIVALSLAALAACTGHATDSSAASTTWTAANTVSAPDFARELTTATGPAAPVIAFTGPAFLYRVGHIPGAVNLGPSSTPAGLTALKAWAQSLPRSANIVVYCGCCPLEVCPNLAPSFTTLQGMGFTRVRVLILPNNFGTDWAGKGYPIVR